MLYSKLMFITFMFVGHINSKFAQDFTLNYSSKFHCCLQLTLNIVISDTKINKLHNLQYDSDQHIN